MPEDQKVKKPETDTDNKETKEAFNKEDEGMKAAWDIRPYLSLGLTIVIVIFICLVMYFAFLRIDSIVSAIKVAINSLWGVIGGLVLAYLLNPVMRMIESRLRKKFALPEGHPKRRKRNRMIRAISVSGALIIFILLIALLLRTVVPQVIISVQDLIVTMDDKVNTLIEWIERLVKTDGQLVVMVEEYIQDISSSFQSWIINALSDSSGDIISSVTTGVVNVFKFLVNCLVALIVSVYVLMTKERFIGQAKKLVYAIFRPRIGNIVMEVIQKSDECFGGFFVGKIIDSIIIGFICYAAMFILKLPYAVLISVIIGVTNIIPFFGPFIGAIPSTVLIFIVNPIQAVYFLILILCLQQFDGNILGPKILGNSTGLSPFWVVFACTFFGGCFGIAGMILGVPIFAIIYYIIKRITEHYLRKEGLPDETRDYIKLYRMDAETGEILYRKKGKKPIINEKLFSWFRFKKKNKKEE